MNRHIHTLEERPAKMRARMANGYPPESPRMQPQEDHPPAPVTSAEPFGVLYAKLTREELIWYYKHAHRNCALRAGKPPSVGALETLVQISRELRLRS